MTSQGRGLLILFLLVSSCSPKVIADDGLTATAPQVQISETATPVIPSATPTLPAARETPDLTHLPIGDGLVSNQPRIGHLWNCPMGEGGQGAMQTGEWFDEISGTYDLTIRPSVDGAVTWQSEVSIRIEGEVRVIEANGLPAHPAGIFPVQASDDAAEFDRNPNSISAQDYYFEIPAYPQMTTPSCASGEVGVSIQGVVINNAFDALERDAVAHEIQDTCFGHPHQGGVYHYHGYSPCLEEQDVSGPSVLIGYALDGFGIYGPYDIDGTLLTSADLDECHGKTSLVQWDGEWVEMYHYVATYDFPYTVGCFRGTPINAQRLQGGSEATDPSQGAGGQPPQAAINACAGLTQGSSCSFNAPNGLVSGSCQLIANQLACRP
jgi:hypothetical protein